MYKNIIRSRGVTWDSAIENFKVKGQGMMEQGCQQWLA